MFVRDTTSKSCPCPFPLAAQRKPPLLKNVGSGSQGTLLLPEKQSSHSKAETQRVEVEVGVEVSMQQPLDFNQGLFSVLSRKPLEKV